jgi:cytochrome c oxidase assembly protein subunit 11
MPVQFVIDAALPASVTTLTLSYTFFEVPAADKKNVSAPVTAGSAG